jgi:WD40 repeat protein
MLGAKSKLRPMLARLRLSPAPPSGARYHGFISYSHAADGRLAPALQKGLQRFAKPWYRTRALHVFRDDAVLSANPHLWGSIRDSLERSEHFILLASPEAAASEWVVKEAQYWRSHKRADKILIGLTHGELAWDGRGAGLDDHRTNALPQPLRDAFAEEPLYVDLRWAQNADDLTLTHPDWREAVASLAAPLHGLPKEELASEEVRQHRRTVRIARTAAATLISLTVAAIVLGLVAYSQYRSAQARALAAEATADLATNPEQSLALALKSTQTSESAAGLQALRLALAQAAHRVTIESGVGAGVQAAWSPAGDQLAISAPREAVQLWNPRTGRLQHVLSGGGTSSLITQLRYSPDGRWLAAVTRDGAVEVWDVAGATPVSTAQLNRQIRASFALGGSPNRGGASLLGTTVVWSSGRGDALAVYGFGLDRVLVFDPSSGRTGDLAAAAQYTSGTDVVAPSPDGTRLLIAGQGSSLTGSAEIVDVRSGRAIPLNPAINTQGHEACWFADSKGFITWDPTEAQDLTLRWWNAQSGREVAAYPSSNTITATACSLSSAQDWAATGTRDGTVLLHLVNGTTFQLAGHSRFITSMASSPDGDYLATASDDGTARVWDTRTGAQLRVLPDGNAVTGVQFSPDGGLALTTDQSGSVRVWDTGVGEPVTRLAIPAGGRTYALGFAANGRLVFGVNAVQETHTYAPFRRPPAPSAASVLLWSSASGAIVRRISLPADVGVSQVASGISCNKQGLFLEACTLSPPSNLVVPLPVPGQFNWGLLGVAVSADGSEVAYAQPDQVTVVGSDGKALARVSSSEHPTGVALSGGKLVVMTDRAVYVGAARAAGGLLRLPQRSPPMDAELSADGRRLATADLDGSVTVYETARPAPVAVFHVTRAFAAEADQVSGGLIHDRSQGGPPVPLRVAINGDGSSIAVGTSWQTVFVWNVGDRRLIAARFLSSPVDRGVGAAGAATAGGFDGPWGIAELGYSADGSRLLAVDFPIYTATDSTAPATAEVFSSSGSVVAAFDSPDIPQGAIDPGAGLNPSGTAVLAGVLNVAPQSSTGHDAVYEASTGELLLGLSTADLPPGSAYYDWPSPAQPWAPNGIDVLAGNGTIYACDACGSPAQMEQTARTRLAWRRALTAAQKAPPRGDPYA